MEEVTEEECDFFAGAPSHYTPLPRAPSAQAVLHYCQPCEVEEDPLPY